MSFLFNFSGKGDDNAEDVYPPSDVVIEQNGIKYFVHMAEVKRSGELVINKGEAFETIKPNVNLPVTPNVWTKHTFGLLN